MAVPALKDQRPFWITAILTFTAIYFASDLYISSGWAELIAELKTSFLALSELFQTWYYLLYSSSPGGLQKSAAYSAHNATFIMLGSSLLINRSDLSLAAILGPFFGILSDHGCVMSTRSTEASPQHWHLVESLAGVRSSRSFGHIPAGGLYLCILFIITSYAISHGSVLVARDYFLKRSCLFSRMVFLKLLQRCWYSTQCRLTDWQSRLVTILQPVSSFWNRWKYVLLKNSGRLWLLLSQFPGPLVLVSWHSH